MNWALIKLRLVGRPVRLTTALSVGDCKKRLHVRFRHTSQKLRSERLSGFVLGNFVFIGLSLFVWLSEFSEPKIILKLQPDPRGTVLTGRAIPGFVFLFVIMIMPILLGLVMIFQVKLLQPTPPNLASPLTYIAVKWGFAAFLFAAFLGWLWLVLLEPREKDYAKMTSKLAKLLDANPSP